VKSAHQVDINGYLQKELPLTKAASGFNVTIPKDAFYVILNTSEPTVTTANPEGLKVYPNPTKGSIVIEVPAEWELQNTLQIFDHTGRKVYQKQNLTAGKNTITLPKLSAGLYEVVVTHSKTKEKKVHKVMIGG
jgi:hypothetical protein